MDFDLFELGDDDDILLSSVCIEPTQQHAEGQPQTEALIANDDNDVLPELHCIGEDSIHSNFSTEGFIKCNYLLRQPEQIWSKLVAALTLSDFDFGAVHLRAHSTMHFLFGTTCMHIQNFWVNVRQPTSTSDVMTHYQRRRQVTKLLYLLLHNTHKEQWPLQRAALNNLRQLLNRVTEAETWKLVYYANSCKGNECNVITYHFLHGALEWKLLILCILQKFENSATTTTTTISTEKSSILMQQMKRLCLDLVTCTLYLYAKKRPAELLFSTPFPCTCFKECWLFLQIAIERWYGASHHSSGEQCNFWNLFNETIETVKTCMDKFALTTLGLTECCNWMIHALVRLFGYRSNGLYVGPTYKRATVATAENYEFCERNILQFLGANPNEEQLRVYICLLMPTVLQWWRPHVGIPMLLWEHYHKRLNTSFYVAGTAPSNLAVSCATGKAYVERYRALLAQSSMQDANLCSYTLFTLLLGKTLQHLLDVETHTRNQAQKLLGRIYTKFSAQKFLALNETGIHHLIELFVVLALCGDFADVAPKLCPKLLSITLDKITPLRQIAITKGHMALLILYAERHCELGEYVSKLLQQLANIHNDVAVAKVIADGLLDIFMQAEDFRRGEHLLIDAWLPNFLNNCTPVEQDRCLEALHLIFLKLQRAEGFIEPNLDLFKSLNAHVLPFLKQHFMSGFSQWLPQLAADFCTHSSTVPDTQCFKKLFSFFIETPAMNRQAVPQFLLKVLQTERGTLVDDNVIIHVWLKSLVQLTAMNEDVVQLTRLVVQLPEYKLVTELEPSELLQAKEPLCVFIAAVGKNYNAHSHDIQRRHRITDSLNSYLSNFERWLQHDLKQEKMELTFRFYSFLAIVIYNCPDMVYTRSKVNCFFHTVITRFVLPPNVQMGKPPEGKLPQLIHKIWPVLVQGIGRLNFKHDMYLNKTLTDLIQKWAPHFKISPNSKVVARPYITCLQSDNAALSLFVCEKLTSLFLATQRRQADPNACLVVTIFQEVVESITNTTEITNTQQLETFMKGTSLLMLEHIMMVDEVVPSRSLLLELFKRICNCEMYRRSAQLQDLLAEHFKLLAKKHLAYYTFFYFDLLMKFAQISAVTVRQIMDFLLVEVQIVEGKRGAGEDNRIRGCVQKLQQCLK